MASDHHHVMSEDEERRAIVSRYEKGREKVLHEIDEWEDPKFELYLVTDRYGFINQTHLPDKLTQFESKIRAIEASRSSKWVKMLEHWERFVNQDKLRQRVYKGIPDQIRGTAWCLLLGVAKVKSEQEGRYQEMLEWGLRNSTDVRQIDLDINRTFRNNLMYRERYNTKQQELFRVLVAYSVYNAEIGYCQGMSQIAALLLMYLHDEEDAFWGLDRLMSDDKYAMHGFFIPGFPKLVRFAKHHDLILKRYLPKVYKHFKKYDIDSTLYTLKWFFQCFLDRVPFSLTLRLWDSFMLDGEIILTCMSYTLLKLHKKSVLRKGMEDSIEFLQVELEKDFGYHDDQAINALQQSIQELKKHKMDVPKEAPSENERPLKPFGFLLQADNLSIMTDNHSIAGSIILKPPDAVSLAQTSRASSEGEPDDARPETENSRSDFNDSKSEENGPENMQRSLSLYDNVDIRESIEAAKRFSDVDSQLSGESGRRSQAERIPLNVIDSSLTTHRTSSRVSSPISVHSAHTSSEEPILRTGENMNMNMNSNMSREPVDNMIYSDVNEIIINNQQHEHPVDSKKPNSGFSLSESLPAYPTATSSGTVLESPTKVLLSLRGESSDPSDRASGDFMQAWPDSFYPQEKISRDRESKQTQSGLGEHSVGNNYHYGNDPVAIPVRLPSPSPAEAPASPHTPSPTYWASSDQTPVSPVQIDSKPFRDTDVSPTHLTRKTSIPKLASRKRSERSNGESKVSPTSPPSGPTSPSSGLTSPTGRPSLIPRYVSRSPSSPTSPNNSIANETNLSQQRTYYSNSITTSPEHNSNHSFINANASERVRIYVPYGGKQATPGLPLPLSDDCNKVKLRVGSPLEDVGRQGSRLPTVDT